MKILFLSHYKNSGKLGLYAQGIMLALHKSGIEIVFRHIENNADNSNKLNPILLPIENESLADCTHCIQFLQSEFMLGTKKFTKNIAILLEKPKNIHELIIFDEIWVFDDNLKESINLSEPQIIVKTINPLLLNIQDKLEYIYNSIRKIDFEDLSLNSVGMSIKEALSA